MDCNDAKTKIDMYVDDLLDDAEKQRLIWHAASCPDCKKALDDAVRLKQAFTNLKEMEPPKGLAAAAVKKAKRHGIPVWAYASAAAAAVVALLFALSPAVTPREDNTLEDDQKLVYSAEAGEEMAQDYGDSMMPETEAAGVLASEAPTENLIAVAPEVKTSGAGITAYVDNTFTSEADFIEAMRSEAVEYYWRPRQDPLGGATLMQIEVTEHSVRWVYSYGEEAPQTLVFEWYRTLNMDDIAAWEEEMTLRSDLLAHSFRQGGDVFWSANGRFDENGEMIQTDATAINAYWSQDAGAFHAELPPEFTELDILQICMMEIVPVE